MSELHKFIFDGLPVRGMVVRLTEAWQEILRRRAGNTATGAYPPPVRELLGEMAAAGVLMQGNIKFNGALVPLLPRPVRPPNRLAFPAPSPSNPVHPIHSQGYPNPNRPYLRLSVYLILFHHLHSSPQ